MNRPLSVTLISYLFIVSGVTGIIYHASEFKDIFTERDALWVLAVRLLAIVGGIFTLRGANWARWLLVVWIVYHVAISFYHSIEEVVMHAVITVVVVIGLFHKKAKLYFLGKN
jgi:hypothetical protein